MSNLIVFFSFFCLNKNLGYFFYGLRFQVFNEKLIVLILFFQKIYKRLSLKEKIDIIQKYENGTKNNVLAEMYNVAHSTISDVVVQKNKYKQQFENVNKCQGNVFFSRLETYDNPLEKAVYTWLVQERSLGHPVSGLLLQEKARELHTKLKLNWEFKASDGWLRRFKDRHKIRTLKLCGEKLMANYDDADEFVTELARWLEDYQIDLDNVYNADETGFYWRSLPMKSLVTGEEREAPGMKPAKKRVTILNCANATGTDRIPLLIIDKAKKPRSFKEPPTILWYYKNQSNAWMDRELFMWWFKNIFIPHVKQHNPNGKK